MIRVTDLWKSFGAHQVLKGISLEIPTGSTCVILGGSGSGKTVLMKHVIGLLKPDRGTVLVDDVEIPKLEGKALTEARRMFGMVFQQAALFDSMTVFENVTFPLREKTSLPWREIAERANLRLEQVGLGGIGHKDPAEISGGMRKRVAIARALVTDPEIVFFDEPTTGLDPILVNAIHRLILDLHGKLRFTAVIVSHEIPEIFDLADTIAMLHEGVIVEAGAAAAIRASANPVVRQFIHGEPDGTPSPM